MGGQEFLMNHTIKHIVRIENDGHYYIADELRKVIEKYDWKLTDDVELVIYENCDKDVITELVMNENYRIDGDDAKWFVW
jgi:hypothetical protein